MSIQTFVLLLKGGSPLLPISLPEQPSILLCHQYHHKGFFHDLLQRNAILPLAHGHSYDDRDLFLKFLYWLAAPSLEYTVFLRVWCLDPR